LPNDTGRFFVLTGGPGSGKTTLIEALGRAGFVTSAEAGRGVIREQAAIGGRGLPWENPLLFAELMLSWEMRSYRLAEAAPGPVFFDRGIPDVLGYLRLCGTAPPEHLLRAAQLFRYNRRAFILPPWRDIFHADTERKQDLTEAERTHAAMVAIYGELGYELVSLPRATVAQRADSVIAEARAADAKTS
jgi:predicted ATPase